MMDSEILMLTNLNQLNNEILMTRQHQLHKQKHKI